MQFNLKDKVIIVASHPDDEVLGCGGTIASLCRKGISVRVVFLAEGVSSRYNLENINSEKLKKEIKLRNDNSVKALKSLGVKKENIFFENFPCCQLDTIPRLNLVKTIDFSEVAFTSSFTLIRTFSYSCVAVSAILYIPR